MYAEGKTAMKLKFTDAQKQSSTNNLCGLYSNANAYEFCATGFVGDRIIKYDGQKMREHSIACLENGEIREFPKLKDMKKTRSVEKK